MVTSREKNCLENCKTIIDKAETKTYTWSLTWTMGGRLSLKSRVKKSYKTGTSASQFEYYLQKKVTMLALMLDPQCQHSNETKTSNKSDQVGTKVLTILR